MAAASSSALPRLVAKPKPDAARLAKAQAEAKAARSGGSASAASRAAAAIAAEAAAGKSLMRDPHDAGAVFHTVELESKDRRPDYIYYDSISYPRVTRDLPQMNPESEMNNMWIVGFLDHEDTSGPEGPSAQHVREYERRFGVKRGADADAKVVAKMDKERLKREAADRAFTKEETKRLRELEAMFRREEADEARGPLNPRQEMALKLSRSAYATENRKIRKVLQLRGKGGKRQLALFGSHQKKKVVQSAALENLAYLERLEQQAAVVIQRSFRKFHRILFWKKWMRASVAAIAIQKCARGYIIRRLVKDWVKQRESLITKAQSVIRGKLARDDVKREKNYLASAATDIQRAFRGFLWRYNARLAIRHREATRIQKLWRGVVARARADRVYLDAEVCKIQTIVRRWLQNLRFKRDIKEQANAATRIQALFRSYRARIRRNDLLWDRETRARESWMGIIRGEQHWLDSEIERRVKQRTRDALDEQVKLADDAWRKVCDQVALYEFDLVSLENERLKLSPRAVQQGWAVQLLSDSEQHREWVTEYKARAMFEAGAKFRALRDRRDREDVISADLLAARRECETRWLDERNALWRRLNERRWASERLELAKRAADEKRRWQVRHFTDTGKPDLALESRLEGLSIGTEAAAETRVFSMATQSVLALLPDAASGTDETERRDRERQRRIMDEHALATGGQLLTSGDFERHKLGAGGSAFPAAGAAAAAWLGAERARHPAAGLLTDGVRAGAGAGTGRADTLPALQAPTVDEHGNFIGFAGGLPATATLVGSRVLGSEAPRPPMAGSSLAAMRAGTSSAHRGGGRGVGRVVGPDAAPALSARPALAEGAMTVDSELDGAELEELRSTGDPGEWGRLVGGGAASTLAAADMHARAFARSLALGDAPAGMDADEAEARLASRGAGFGDGGVAQGEAAGPDSQFAADIARAKRGLARMPVFMRSGLVSSTVGDEEAVGEAVAVTREALAGDAQTLRALASLPPGMLAARRADAAAAIARSRARGTVGFTTVSDRRAERRAAIEAEISEFNRQGDRVQRLADRLGAVSGALETQQYGALLKPLFSNMNKLMERLNAAPEAAARVHAIEAEGGRIPMARTPAGSGSTGRGHGTGDDAPLLEPVALEELPPEYRARLAGRLGEASDAAFARGRSRSPSPMPALPSDTAAGGRRQLPPIRNGPGGLPDAARSRVRTASRMVDTAGSGAAAGSVGAGKRVRVKRKQYASTIPWSLLDELEAEKDKLLEEQKRVLPHDERWDQRGHR